MSKTNSNPNRIFNLTPLGGVAEIGSNMMLVETPNDCFIIDCGILFPDDNLFDIRYLIPDFNYIKRTPSHIIITHGHEDHIGAITHLINKFPQIELWAPPFSADLIRHKFEYIKMSHPISVYKENDYVSLTDIDVHPVHVNHSIPETFGLLMIDKKKSFSAFYASDFKVDDHSPYEKIFQLFKNSETHSRN